MNFYKVLMSTLLMSAFLLVNTAFAEDIQKSGTLVIDETQVSILIGGNIGGGVLLFDDMSRSFKTSGLKLGGIGINKVHLIGDVYELNNIDDFAGVYATFEMGATLGKASKNSLWLKNSKGVKINLKSSSGTGASLSLSVEGFNISLK